MVKAVIDRQAQRHAGDGLLDIHLEQANRRVRFLRPPILRLLSTPNIYDTPFTVADTFALKIQRLGGTCEINQKASPFLGSGKHERLI